MIRWHVHPLQKSLGEHAEQWDALLKRLFGENPMLDSRYVDALLRHFGSGAEQLCVCDDGETVVGMCLLQRRSMGVWATFLPAQAQIGPALLADPAHVQALFAALPGLVLEIDFLCNDPAYGDLSSQDNSRGTNLDHALTISIDLTGGFDAYWSSRSKKLVQNIGRYERRLRTDGMSMRLERIETPEQMGEAVARYATLESSGWKGTQGTAVRIGDTQGDFYQDLMLRMATSGKACVYELWLGDRLAASRLCLVGGDGVAIMLKTTYDETLSKYSPGRLLLHQVIRDLFERNPGGRIEFYTDANPDQISWATRQRWITHAGFFRNALAENGLRMLRATRNARRRNNSKSNLETSTTESVDVYHHPSEFPPEVTQLFAAAESGNIECGVSWYQNLIDHVYPGSDEVQFYVLRRDGRPVAALPVQVHRQRSGIEVKALTNYYCALYAPILEPTLKALQLAALLRAIRTANDPLRSVTFAPMDPRSHAYRILLNALEMTGLMPFRFFKFGNWYQPMNCNWPAYLAGREGQLRSTIKRMGKKFASEGGVLQIVSGADGLDRAIDAYTSVYARSWKVPEPYPGFMPGLIRTCAAKGWLRMGIAWLGEVPIAAQVWIVANAKANIYKLAYDDKYKAYAPGTLLTAALMQHCIERDKVDEADYLIGDDPYKKSWMSERRERWGIVAYDMGTIGGWWNLFREIGGRLLRTMSNRNQSAEGTLKNLLPEETRPA